MTQTTFSFKQKQVPKDKNENFSSTTFIQENHTATRAKCIKAFYKLMIDRTTDKLQ